MQDGERSPNTHTKKSFAGEEKKKEHIELNNLSQLDVQIPEQPPLYKSNL